MKTAIAILATMLLANAALAQDRGAYYGPFTDSEAQLLRAVWPEIREAANFEDINWSAHGLARAPGSREVQRAMAANWDEVRQARRFEEVDWTEVVDGRNARNNRGGGGYDHAGIHSIAIDPQNPKRITVAVSTGGAWQTKDGGATWAICAKGMYAEYMPPAQRFEQNAQDVHRLVLCAAQPEVMWAQHHNGVFRSTDGAQSWQEVTAIRPSKFGFAVAAHPKNAHVAWFVPAVKDECRVPVDAKLVVARTRDGGRSFQVLRKGLPQAHAYDLVYRHCLDVDRSGKRVAFGSTTGGLWMSEDQGDSWRRVSTQLPPIHCVRFG